MDAGRTHKKDAASDTSPRRVGADQSAGTAMELGNPLSIFISTQLCELGVQSVLLFQISCNQPGIAFCSQKTRKNSLKHKPKKPQTCDPQTIPAGAVSLEFFSQLIQTSQPLPQDFPQDCSTSLKPQ